MCFIVFQDVSIATQMYVGQWRLRQKEAMGPFRIFSNFLTVEGSEPDGTSKVHCDSGQHRVW